MYVHAVTPGGSRRSSACAPDDFWERSYGRRGIKGPYMVATLLRADILSIRKLLWPVLSDAHASFLIERVMTFVL